jgi:hypothetical protein
MDNEQKIGLIQEMVLNPLFLTLDSVQIDVIYKTILPLIKTLKAGEITHLNTEIQSKQSILDTINKEKL